MLKRKIAHSPEHAIDILNLLAASAPSSDEAENEANWNTLDIINTDVRINNWEWTSEETIKAFIRIARDASYDRVRWRALSELGFFGTSDQYAAIVIDGLRDIINYHADVNTRKHALACLKTVAYYDGYGNNDFDRPFARAVAKLYIDTLANTGLPEEARCWAGLQLFFEQGMTKIMPLLDNNSVEKLLNTLNTEPDTEAQSLAARILYRIHEASPQHRTAINPYADEIDRLFSEFCKKNDFPPLPKLKMQS